MPLTASIMVILIVVLGNKVENENKSLFLVLYIHLFIYKNSLHFFCKWSKPILKCVLQFCNVSFKIFHYGVLTEYESRCEECI